MSHTPIGHHSGRNDDMSDCSSIAYPYSSASGSPEACVSFWEDKTLVIHENSPTYCPLLLGNGNSHGISSPGIVRSVVVKQVTHISGGWWDFLLVVVSTGKSATIVCRFYTGLDLVSLLGGRGIIFRSTSLFDSRIEDLPPNPMSEGEIWDVLFCFVTKEGLVRDVRVLCCGYNADLMRKYFDI